MEWTPEKIEELRVLFLEKSKSFRQIADLWKTTPGTIAGRCHRNGFKRDKDKQREPSHPEAIDLVKVKTKPAAPKAVRPKKKPAQRAKPKPPADPAPIQVPVVHAEKTNVVIGKVTMQQIEGHHCRWPTNDNKPFVFCGAARTGNGPYCDTHTKKSYAPPKPPIRVARG